MDILTHRKHSRHLNIAITTVAALVTFILLMAHQFYSQYEQFQEELRTQAAIIGANSSAAMIFKDKNAANEILEAISLNPRIMGGALYRSDGELFVQIDGHSLVFPDRIAPPDVGNLPAPTFDIGFFASFLRHEVVLDGAQIGTLVLHFTYKPLYWNLLKYAFGLIFIGLAAFLLAFRFTARLRKKMAFTKGKIEQMALYDRVTGLPNRRFFEHELKKAIARIRRGNENAALLMIDVDDFKKVNDLCGHQTGDEVLYLIAKRLKRAVRSDDVIARVGGDEFAAILFRVGTPEMINGIAGKMIAAIAEPFPTKPIPSHVGLSIGITVMPNDSADPATLISWADMAMYEAKSQGKNRAQFFSEEINSKIRSDLQIESNLREAIRSPESGLYVVYQPLVSAATKAIVGAEALIRWKLANGTLLSPGDFIPIAEKTGLIIEMGAWLINRICQDLAKMRQCGVELPKISINVSPRELTRGNTIVENARQTLTDFGESVSRFQFEITENALMDKNGAEVLDAFHESGFSLAIDDFGSGYSSLGYLKRFQVSTLKIDRQFVQRLPEDSEDAAIVSAVIQMSKALGINVVAEGVETEAQAEFLTVHGCDILQGYWISRPVVLGELIEFIRGNTNLAAQ